jgi:hypothetical protein
MSDLGLVASRRVPVGLMAERCGPLTMENAARSKQRIRIPRMQLLSRIPANNCACRKGVGHYGSHDTPASDKASEPPGATTTVSIIL